MSRLLPEHLPRANTQAKEKVGGVIPESRCGMGVLYFFYPGRMGMGSCHASGFAWASGWGVLPGHLDGVLPGHLDGVLPGHLDEDLPRHLDEDLPRHLDEVLPRHLDEVLPRHLDEVLPRHLDEVLPRHLDEVLPMQALG